MSLNAKKASGGGGNNRVQQAPLEDGSYPCRVVQILDLGIQPQRAFQGKEKPPAHEMMITYEFLDEFCVDEEGKELEDKPRWLSETFPLYNLEADKAKSTKRYMALDPDLDLDGDFTQLVGTPCVVTVVQNPKGDKVYTNIQAVSPMRTKDAAKAPDSVNPSKVLGLEVFGSLPEWLQDKIKGNLEYEGSALQKALDGEAKQEPKEDKQEPEQKPEDDKEEESYDDDTPW